MAKNRFEQVDELQPDAITISLAKRGDAEVGRIHCPKTAAPDQLPGDLNSGDLTVREAVIGAIQLANAKKLPIVVLDPDALWTGEYGVLWRYQEED
jgi:hypothetical protein